MESQYFQDSKGVYKKSKSGERIYLSPEELSGFDIKDSSPPPATATKTVPFGSDTYLPRSEGKPWSLPVNFLADILDEVPRSVKGAGELLKSTRNLVGFTPIPGGPPVNLSPEFTQPTEEYQPQNFNLNEIGKSIATSRYGAENLKQNPATPLLDLASILTMIPRASSSIPGIAELGAKLKSKGTLGVQKYFGPGIRDAEFRIPELFAAGDRTVPPSSMEDVVTNLKTRGAATPTIGQMSGDPTALNIEMQRPEVEKILQSQYNAAQGMSEDLLRSVTPAGTRATNMAASPTEVVRPIRKSVISSRKLALEEANSEITSDQLNLVNHALKVNPNISDIVAKRGIVEATKFIREGMKGSPNERGKIVRLFNDPTLDRLEGYLTHSEWKLSELEKTYHTPLAKLLLNSKDHFAELVGKGNVDPVRWDYLKNQNFTKALEVATKDQNSIAELANLPGVGRERAGQMLVWKLFNDSKVDGQLSPLKLYKAFSDPNNAKMLATMLPDSKTRVGVQQFAHTMKVISKYDQAALDKAALTFSNRESGSLASGIGAFVPMAIGGNFAQMRAGYSASTFTILKLKGGMLAKILSNPDGAWLMDRLGKLNKTSPSLPGTVRSLIKVMGQLNVPAIFDVDGKEVEIPPSRPTN